MEIGLQFQRLCHVQIHKLLLIMGVMAAVVVLIQLFALPYENYISILSRDSKGTRLMTVGSNTFLNSSTLSKTYIVHGVVNSTSAFKLDEEESYKSEGAEDKDYDFASDDDGEINKSFEIDPDRNSHSKFISERGLAINKSLTIRTIRSKDNSSSPEKIIKFRHVSVEQLKKSDENSAQEDPTTIIFTGGMEHLDSRTLVTAVAANLTSIHNGKQDMETRHKDLERTVSTTLHNNSTVADKSIMKKRGMRPATISHMNLLLLQTSVSTNSMRPRWSSARDRELQHAKLLVENAPIARNTAGLHASLFRNVSMFKRSYELMERMLKVYIYREGEEPIFHQPMMRGIYASEGWFMKLMEGNKKFVVRDPKKAHLFYLPFSSLKLRGMLREQNFARQKDLEKHLKDYIAMIAKKYRFWNRANGSDHFLVACHDWAPRFTRNNMGTCIRALCNSNVARGFKIGKDVSLPVTLIRTSQNPQKDLGGNLPSERPVLAFFAGGIHGYLRPILLQYWNNKEPDMKVFGPMPRDIEGKTRYRELMKSSKYCICAKGYEVHTPRVVESIYYECVPVIISDNYVPPFFGVLDWESFSVFILEEDIPNLRNILLSISEEKYLAMQHRVKMVQQHFLWHKQPMKYDLFHMILHSIWYNRVFQV